MAYSGPGLAKGVGGLTIVISLMLGGWVGEVQLAVLIVRHQCDALAICSFCREGLIVLEPLVSWRRVSVSTTLKHKSVKVSEFKNSLFAEFFDYLRRLVKR